MKGSWALVTGASAGFGHAIAHELGKRGVNLMVTARREDRLLKLKSELEKACGIEVRPLVFDISDLQACKNVMQKESDHLKKVSILVNNAGLAKGTETIPSAKFEDWDQMIDTNIKGLLYMTRFVLPQMLTNGSGHIINIGSVAGRWVYPGGAVYCATKHAVRAISEGLRMDLMGTKIRVTNIEPGSAETEFSEVRIGDANKAKTVYQGMTPLSAHDIAETVMWCLERPAHVNIQELVIFPTDQAAVGPSYMHRRPS